MHFPSTPLAGPLSLALPLANLALHLPAHHHAAVSALRSSASRRPPSPLSSPRLGLFSPRPVNEPAESYFTLGAFGEAPTPASTPTCGAAPRSVTNLTTAVASAFSGLGGLPQTPAAFTSTRGVYEGSSATPASTPFESAPSGLNLSIGAGGEQRSEFAKHLALLCGGGASAFGLSSPTIFNLTAPTPRRPSALAKSTTASDVGGVKRRPSLRICDLPPAVIPAPVTTAPSSPTSSAMFSFTVPPLSSESSAASLGSFASFDSAATLTSTASSARLAHAGATPGHNTERNKFFGDEHKHDQGEEEGHWADACGKADHVVIPVEFEMEPWSPRPAMKRGGVWEGSATVRVARFE